MSGRNSPLAPTVQHVRSRLGSPSFPLAQPLGAVGDSTSGPPSATRVKGPAELDGSSTPTRHTTGGIHAASSSLTGRAPLFSNPSSLPPLYGRRAASVSEAQPYQGASNHNTPRQQRGIEAQWITRGASSGGHGGHVSGSYGGMGSGSGPHSQGNFSRSSTGEGSGRPHGSETGDMSRMYHDSFNSHTSPTKQMPDYLKVRQKRRCL